MALTETTRPAAGKIITGLFGASFVAAGVMLGATIAAGLQFAENRRRAGHVRHHHVRADVRLFRHADHGSAGFPAGHCDIVGSGPGRPASALVHCASRPDCRIRTELSRPALAGHHPAVAIAIADPGNRLDTGRWRSGSGLLGAGTDGSEREPVAGLAPGSHSAVSGSPLAY
jgi:hypothetical protein